jgi:hypothetical protein
VVVHTCRHHQYREQPPPAPWWDPTPKMLYHLQQYRGSTACEGSEKKPSFRPFGERLSSPTYPTMGSFSLEYFMALPSEAVCFARIKHESCKALESYLHLPHPCPCPVVSRPCDKGITKPRHPSQAGLEAGQQCDGCRQYGQQCKFNKYNDKSLTTHLRRQSGLHRSPKPAAHPSPQSTHHLRQDSARGAKVRGHDISWRQTLPWLHMHLVLSAKASQLCMHMEPRDGVSQQLAVLAC